MSEGAWFISIVGFSFLSSLFSKLEPLQTACVIIGWGIVICLMKFAESISKK